ncbi:hypothetical protein F4604DRAFT_1716751 [Suillus subluteus]|nr:hypothetical protein F4604DRAFT_1716751 [Suillus subluteus]
MTCLRGKGVNALAQAQDNAVQRKFSGLYNVFHSVLDGVLISGHPTSKLQRNEFVHVTLIVRYGTGVISVPRSLQWQCFTAKHPTRLVLAGERVSGT